MENKILGVAIVGAGAIASVHADSYNTFSDQCKIVAVCDLFKDKAQTLADEKAPEAKVYGDVEEMLKDENIDIVSICLPPTTHADITVKALNYGKHVLVEKPMASSLEECDMMIKAAKDNGKVLSVVCQNRFKTPMMKVKKMLDDGVVGKINQTVVSSLWWRGANYYDIWWRGTWEKEGGGCLTSHAVHHLDLMQWMIGMPEYVTAVMSNVAHDNSECEDLGMAILEYPAMLAQVTASIVNHGEEQELIFQGDKGRLSIPWRTQAQKALPNGFPEDDDQAKLDIEKVYEELPELEYEGHTAQIENLLNAINGKGELLIDGTEGRKTIELIMAMYKASTTRTRVKMPLEKDDIFYKRDTMIKAMPHFFEKSKSVDNFTTSKISLGRDVGK